MIKIIRGSADADAARKKLMSAFKLSEIQANHILDMPLRRSTRPRDRARGGAHEAARADRVLQRAAEGPEKLRGVIKIELLEIRMKHANGRRTQIKADDGEFDVEDLIAEEDVIITVSRAGYVKRLPVDAFKKQGRGGKGVRAEPEGRGRRQARVHDDHAQLDAVLHHEGSCVPGKAHEIPESGRTACGMYAANLPGSRSTATRGSAP